MTKRNHKCTPPSIRKSYFLKYVTLILLIGFIQACDQKKVNVNDHSKKTVSNSSTVPSLDELAGDWMEVKSLLNMPSVNNFHGGLGVSKDLCSVELLTFPPIVQDGQSCETFVNGKKLEAQYSQWYPYQVLRKATLEGMDVTSTTRMVFENQGVLIRVEFNNTAKETQNIVFKLNLSGKARKFEERWNWVYPRVKDTLFDIKLEKNNSSLIIQDNKSEANTVYAFPIPPKSFEVKDKNGIASWDLTIPKGKSIVLDYVMAVGDDIKRDKEMADHWSQKFESTFEQAKTLWEARWHDVFTPNNGHFSGHLPTLETEDKKLRRVYYMDIASTLQLYRTNMPKSNRVFATNGPEWGVSLMYFWNMEMWPTTWAMLEPSSMKEHLRSWLSMDYHNCYARDYVSGQGSGPWYGANDWSIFRCIDGYLSVTGDKDFLDEEIAGRSVLEHLEGLATNYRKFVRKDNVLADYGGAENLLECVPTYINRVPSLNAANVWMLRRIADIHQKRGDLDSTKELRDEADLLMAEVLKLYSPGEGVWNSIHRDNKKVEMRHVYDFVMVGKTLSKDLTPKIKKEMVNFVEEELLTSNWMRAQSLSDPAADFSDRPDHGPMGSYDAWPPLSMDVMCQFGEFQKALEFLHRTENATKEGPFAQSHELLGKENDALLRIAKRGYQCYNDAGAAYADVILKSFFGFQTHLFKDTPSLLTPDIPRKFNGKLKHIPYHGSMFEVISDNEGVRLQKE